MSPEERAELRRQSDEISFGPYSGAAEGGRAGYMGGGITGIRKPNAIAPTGGPQSQGLASTPEYDTYNKEYKWQT